MMNINQTAPAHIVIIGAAGGIGRQCIEAALEAGQLVTAVLRHPEKLILSHPNLQVFQGDITDPASFSTYLEGKDAVISAIGVSGGFGSDKPTTLYSQGAANILQEAERMGVKRAFFISASAIEISPVIPFFTRLIVKYVVQKLLKHMYADLRLMEGYIKASGLNWTIIRPPQLTDQPVTGNYRIAINNFLKNCLKISRGDVADFMIKNIDNEKTYRATIEIAY
jgi:putative NADH-flavin reductase